MDTTVIPKVIAHPTDSGLLDKSRQHLIKAAVDNGLRLWLRCTARCSANCTRYPRWPKPRSSIRCNAAGHILTLRTRDKNKLYALHAPEVECISKGKAKTLYAFGVKVRIATTSKKGLLVGMRSVPGNPYDGRTLAETLEQVGILTGTDKALATFIVDESYQAMEIEGACILRSGQKWGIPTP